jgi:hypothetical protein
MVKLRVASFLPRTEVGSKFVKSVYWLRHVCLSVRQSVPVDLGITPVSSVSNGLYFLILPLVSVMRVIYTSKGMPKKFGVRVIH